MWCVSQKTIILPLHRAPNDTQFAHLWRFRMENRPLQVCPMQGVDPLNLIEGVRLLSKALYCASASKIWERGLCQVYYNREPDMVPPPSMAVTLKAVPHLQRSYITYVFRHSDLLVLKITISNACHEKKLKIKKNTFLCCHNIGFFMKVY